MRTNPFHLEPVVLLADYYARNKDIDKALNLIDTSLRNDHKNSSVLQMGKMQLLIDKKDTRAAKTYFKSLQAIGIKPIVANGIEGKIALIEKDYKKASKLLSSFYKAQPSSKNALLLSAALQGNNQTSEAIKHLEDYLNTNTNDHNARAVLANMYISGQPKKAISAYSKILKVLPKNVLVLNNIAWLSMEEGDLNSALSYSEQALELAPKVVNVIDTYAMILFKLNRNSDALDQITQAYELSEGKSNEIALNFAEILIANNYNTKAEEVLKLIKNTSRSQEKRKLSLQNIL